MAIPFYVACDGGILQQEQKKRKEHLKEKECKEGERYKKIQFIV